MMPLFFVYLDIIHYIHSFHHIHTVHSCIVIRRGFSPSPHRCGQLSGKNLPGVPSTESNSSLPYSKPTHYQLSYATPWWLNLAVNRVKHRRAHPPKWVSTESRKSRNILSRKCINTENIWPKCSTITPENLFDKKVSVEGACVLAGWLPLCFMLLMHKTGEPWRWIWNKNIWGERHQ